MIRGVLLIAFAIVSFSSNIAAQGTPSANDLESLVSVEGATVYLSHMMEDVVSSSEDGVGDPVIEPWEEALHVAFILKNDTEWDVTLEIVARASDWQDAYLGACQLHGLSVPAATSARATCTLIDAATSTPFSFPIGHLSGVKVRVDAKLEGWDEPGPGLESLGLQVRETGLDRHQTAASDPNCSYYIPWALIESTVPSEVAVMSYFRFFDADDVLIGSSGEVQRYTYEPKSNVRVPARFNPCFDERLSQPTRVEIASFLL